MKIAASLALFVAVALGFWAINDYRNNEEVRRDFARQGITYLSFRNDAGQPMELDVRGMSDYYERHDAEIGTLSIVSFVVSTLLFRRRSKASEAATNAA